MSNKLKTRQVWLCQRFLQALLSSPETSREAVAQKIRAVNHLLPDSHRKCMRVFVSCKERFWTVISNLVYDKCQLMNCSGGTFLKGSLQPQKFCNQSRYSVKSTSSPFKNFKKIDLMLPVVQVIPRASLIRREHLTTENLYRQNQQLSSDLEEAVRELMSNFEYIFIADSDE